MALSNENSKTECMKFTFEFSGLFRLTQVFIKAVRKVNHGVVEEQNKMKENKIDTIVRWQVVKRHDISLKKIAVGLQFYVENFLNMRQKYEDIFSIRSKHFPYELLRVEMIYRQLCSQRNVLLKGILNVIRQQLRCFSEYFEVDERYFNSCAVFKLIGVYNSILVKIQQYPHFQTLENPREKEISPHINPHIEILVPDVLNSKTKLKRITASNILQIVGLSRGRLVKDGLLSALISVIKPRVQDDRITLPWKPVFYDGVNSLPQVDIFEEAIAMEEDEYARNQRKLDMALRIEFGDDLPETQCLKTSSFTNALPPIDNRALDELVVGNAKLFNALTRKFLSTTGVLVATMMKRSKNGKLRLVKTAKSRLESFFVEKMWGPGTDRLEEVVLWFPLSQFTPVFASPPALMHPLQLFQFLNNIHQYCDKGLLQECSEASCQSLVDECRHIALIAYLDANFIKGFGPYSRIDPGISKLSDSVNCCTEGGEWLVENCEMLVWQVNEIERPEPETEPRDWPIAEEIGFLLCLASLISSLTSVAKTRGSYLLHTWNTSPFFLVTQSDLPRVIDKIRKLILKERDNLVKTDDVGRLQLVLYRERVVNRITSIISTVKALEEQTVKDVSSVCRTVSLAQLQNSMPEPSVWRGIGRIPHEAHEYVYEYIGSVLEPILEAVSKLGVVLQKRAGSTIIKVVCYSWLEHIKSRKIKFSLWGAQQLLKDFHALAEWLRKYPGLEPEARAQMLAVDVLRECEGVARLLMRQPPLVVGYTSNNQVTPVAPLSAGRKHDKELRLSSEEDNIPAEMFVPNQQLWLNLRVRKSTAFLFRLANCCTWPY